jgi:hypothetical protein
VLTAVLGSWAALARTQHRHATGFELGVPCSALREPFEELRQSDRGHQRSCVKVQLIPVEFVMVTVPPLLIA